MNRLTPVRDCQQPSNSGFSRQFKTARQVVIPKVIDLVRRGFDLVASNPRILPLVCSIVIRFRRGNELREAVMPPGGARLVTLHCQRFGRPSSIRLWSGSRGRIDFGQWNCCTAKHP